MNAVPIKGATRLLGKPRDWDDELDGPCGHLAIRDSMLNGVSTMESAWKPSADELKILNAGGCVLLSVVGVVHPPIAMWAESDASQV